MFMNRAGIREAIKLYLSGYPERGTVATERLNDAINMSLRRLWGDLPKSLLRREWKFRLQTAITGTCTVDATDTRIMDIDDSGTSVVSQDGTRDARWMDITDGNGVVHTFRIKQVYRAASVDHIVLDRPWFSTSGSALTFRIYTKEYPIPGDIKSISHIMLEEPGAKPEPLVTVGAEEMAMIQAGQGMDASGMPEAACLGDAYQLPGPQFTPAVSVPTPSGSSQYWGYDSGGVQVAFEPAGTFSYICCLVWGRRVNADGALLVGGTTRSATSFENLPFYMSSPSPASDQISTTWGAGRIYVASPNLAAAIHAPAAHDSGAYPGLEKWWFRARHAVDSTAGSGYTTVQADGVYRLIAITDAATTSLYDNGSYYPPAEMVLTEHSVYRHIRFDKTPTTNVLATARCVIRPPTLANDSDAPDLPSDCIDALIFAAASILAGHRDGNMSRAAEYNAMYNAELLKLRREYGTNHMNDASFGNAIGGTDPRSRLWGIGDWESTS